MYDVEMDPLCTNNLLYFFRYENGGVLFDSERFEQKTYQYRYLMSVRQRRYIRQRFFFLRASLYKEVKKLYIAAHLTEEQMIEEMRFDKIRYITNVVGSE